MRVACGGKSSLSALMKELTGPNILLHLNNLVLHRFYCSVLFAGNLPFCVKPGVHVNLRLTLEVCPPLASSPEQSSRKLLVVHHLWPFWGPESGEKYPVVFIYSESL